MGEKLILINLEIFSLQKKLQLIFTFEILIKKSKKYYRIYFLLSKENILNKKDSTKAVGTIT